MVNNSQNDFQAISDFYNQRCLELGDDIKSVGWRDKESQFLRFEMLFRDIDPSGKTILDFGCGLGDLIYYLEDKVGSNFNYIGIDISESLLKLAEQKHSKPNYKFIHGQILDLDLSNLNIDISVASGVFTYKIANNFQYAIDVCKRLFENSNDIVSLNFLTDRVDYTLNKNYHFNPEAVLTELLKISKHVSLYSDYRLYEFTTILRKSAIER
ncbi:bifunctional 2-polyprenyl-6-hydroxyphenol methylase/3-demethylubiquinol 3-O-methyltransferase UbiG [Bacteriovorax sp. Seq25_V]|uniref:class I SAM-dependent methyltransferase n=1 Tax=Bacteriovorax sp. Seq25_V TaxID=1201288 RepID=UPI00038A17D1|nr:class I SAM-dependent methyltransferase [Bacteriovorax sp. Seq25_V]EQC43241.1 methyltransferase domain protein [Bacteriovorax sp. Seq25_V]